MQDKNQHLEFEQITIEIGYQIVQASSESFKSSLEVVGKHLIKQGKKLEKKKVMNHQSIAKLEQKVNFSRLVEVAVHVLEMDANTNQN